MNWCTGNPALNHTGKTVCKYSIQAKPVTEKDTTNEEVKKVLAQLVSNVILEVKKCIPPKIDTRRKFSNLEKILALEDLDKGMIAVDVAFKHGVNKSLITRWKKNADVIYNAVAGDRVKQLFAKNRKSGKHSKLFSQLFDKFKAARSKGKRCSHLWIYIQASKLF
jgi:hypothetical protein